LHAGTGEFGTAVSDQDSGKRRDRPKYSIADGIVHSDTPIDISSGVDPTTGEGSTDPGSMAMAPEPSSIALLLTALTVAAGLMWRARKPRTSVPAA